MIPFKLCFVRALAGCFFTHIAAASSSLQETSHEADRKGYAGDGSCITGHKDKCQSFEHTPHHLTSRFPTSKSVLGSFRDGSNSLTIVDSAQSAEPGLRFLMEARKEGLFETAQSGWTQNVFQRSERIDLVTGSGARGQTYLYWQGDRLFELPVSYWSDGHRWINSPGYIDGAPDFARP